MLSSHSGLSQADVFITLWQMANSDYVNSEQKEKKEKERLSSRNHQNSRCVFFYEGKQIKKKMKSIQKSNKSR